MFSRLLIGLAFCGCWCSGLAAPVLQSVQASGSDAIHITVNRPGRHLLEIDSAAGFRQPIVKRVFTGLTLKLNAREAGLIPGVPYRIRIDQRVPVQHLLWSPRSRIVKPELTCELLQTTWRKAGRFYVGQAYSQLKWDDATQAWTPVVPAVPLGEALYNTEFYLRPALSAARTCGDAGTLDEIAKYYLAMLAKTETIGALLKEQSVTDETRSRAGISNSAARTFAARFGNQIGEGELYNAQWLHPAALLVRLISEMPEQERTQQMCAFVGQYTPFIVREQLLRFLYEQQMAPLGGRSNRGRVAHWELAMQGLEGTKHWDSAMSDIDLWLISSAAEMVGAQANDPQSVDIAPADLLRLRKAIDTGIRFFQSKRTLYPDTHNFDGKQVGSASYFNGEYDGLAELKGTAVYSEQIPAADKALARTGASWDIGHMYRVAVFLRTLYETKRATGNTFPARTDLELLVNQYVYKVFNGDFSRPLLRNNFDGSDGWFRVGYNGPGFGQPPSAFCDMHDPMRLCMTPGSIIAWAEIAFVNADLEKLQEALLQNVFNYNSDNQHFLNRFYYWREPFGLIVSGDGKICGGAFYAIAAENADRLVPALR